LVQTAAIEGPGVVRNLASSAECPVLDRSALVAKRVLSTFQHLPIRGQANPSAIVFNVFINEVAESDPFDGTATSSRRIA
jgi:hypothetical protein